MKHEGSWLTAVVSLIVGILLIAFHNHLNLITWIVEGIGIVIVVPALWLILANLFGPRERRNYLTVFAAVVALAFGVWICVAPATFAQFIVYLFAAVLIIFGIWHMVTLTVIGRDVKVPFWLFLIPALLVVCGLAFIFTGLRLLTGAVVLIMGIALIASAVNTVLEAIRRHKVKKADASAV